MILKHHRNKIQNKRDNMWYALELFSASLVIVCTLFVIDDEDDM